jgi:hypothetical protein
MPFVSSPGSGFGLGDSCRGSLFQSIRAARQAKRAPGTLAVQSFAMPIALSGPAPCGVTSGHALLYAIRRSSPNMVPLPEWCDEAALAEALDTTTAQGRLVFHMFGALAEFERSLIGSGPKRDSPPLGALAAPEAGRRNSRRTTSRPPRRCWPIPTSA